jgi:putative thioredoxin
MTNLPPTPASLRGAVDLSSLVNRRAAPPAGAAPSTPAAGSSNLVVDVREDTFPSVIELSRQVPVIVEFYGAGIEPSLGALVAEYGGRLVLATVDGSVSPQLAQAFQVAEVPAVAALIAGRPLQLFVGMPEPEQVRAVLDQVLQVAAQQGVTGSVPADGEASVPEDAAEAPLPPHHQEAFDAIASGDLDTAIREYQTAIAQDPRDQLAVAGLAQVSLMKRLQGASAEQIRAAAADAPGDVTAQLAVADLDVSGGHVDDAFARLLDLFPTLDADGKNAVRQRLLDYFEIVGSDDPRVVTARRRLTALLY